MINRYKFRKLNDKKILHKKGKRWIVLSSALLGMTAIGAVSANSIHASNINPNSSHADTSQQVSAPTKPINIARDTDAQQGFGNVDNDPAEMRQDLNYQDNTTGSSSSNNKLSIAQQSTKSVNQHSSSDSSKRKSLQQNNLQPVIASKTTKPRAASANIPKVSNGASTNTSDIEQTANALHSHLLNHADTQKIEVAAGLNKPFNDGMQPVSPHHNDSSALPHYHGTKDVSVVPGVHAYLSSDGTLLDVKGDFSKYNVNRGDKIYGLDGQDNHLFQNVTILDLSDASNLTDACNLFRNMSDLVDVYGTGNWDTSRLKDMTGMFESDINLSDITPLKSWNTSNANSMRGMFSGDIALSNLAPLSNWDTSNVSDMNSMFLGDSVLKSISPLQNWNLSHVNNIGDMFFNDSDIYDLSPLYAWNTGHVKDMSGTFFNLHKIKDLTPLTEWDTHDVNDMSYMFSGDSSVQNLKPLAYWGTSNVNDMSGMFMEDSDVTDLTPIANWDMSHVKDIRTMLASDDLSDLAPLAKWNVSNISDFSQLFLNDMGLANLKPLNNWNMQNAKDISSMFQNTMVSDVTPLAHWQTEQVGNIANTFNNTNISNWSPVKNNWLFSQRPKVKNMPDSDTSQLYQYSDGQWGLSNTEPQRYMATLDYIYNNNVIGSNTFKGTRDKTFSLNDHTAGLPSSYTLVIPGQQYSLNNSTYQVPVKPITVDQHDQQNNQESVLNKMLVADRLDTINYVYNGKTVGSSELMGKKGASFTLGSSPNNLPDQYRVADPGSSIVYDGQTHDVQVELNEAAPVTLSLVNQAGNTVGFVTLKNLGLVGQKVNIAPQVSKMMPLGYSLPSNNPIYITLTNGSSIVINA